MKKGTAGIKQAITKAEAPPPAPAAPDYLTSRFKMLETGLHKKTDENLAWISAPFVIAAETVDEAGCWGVLIQWADRNGTKREEVFRRELFAGECTEIRSRLAAGGMTLMSSQQARQAFGEYLNLASSPNRARCVSRTGWHDIGGERVFVLPHENIGAGGKRVILESSARERPPFNRGGTLADWTRAVAALALGNSRLLFAVGCGFAGALLELTGDDGGGFNLKGHSRVGKTTALRLAASVWGGEPGQGSRAFIRAWRATGNALESIAAVHSDTLLTLDEMAQVDAKEISEIAYMLSNGQGKSRADRSGGMRAQTRFRVLFLSTGEIGLADRNAEAKKITRAGAEVRLIDVAADAGCGHGLFEQLHEESSADSFAEQLRTVTRQFYGTAGPAFVKHIIDQVDADAEFPVRLADLIDDCVAAWLKPYHEPNGQVRSVAKRFAMVAVAGELASQAGITGWPEGACVEACQTILRGYLTERGGVGAKEDEQAVTQLRDFIARHGDARFAEWKTPNSSNDDAPVEAAPIERFRTPNRAGWKRWQNDAKGNGVWVYLMTREAMNEALTGLNLLSAVKVLASKGYLEKDSGGKNTVVRRPPGVEDNIRVYEVKSSILGAGDHDAAE